MSLGRGACVFALALAAPLVGCAVGPDYQRPAAIVPAAVQRDQRLEARHAARRPRQGRMVEAVSAIRELNALEAQVALSNQTLKADEANYRQALALIAEARAGLYPTVNFDPSLTRQKVGRIISYTLDAEVSGSWTLDVWGKVRRADRAAGRRGASQRRRSRQRHAVGAVVAGDRLYPVAAGRSAATIS